MLPFETITAIFPPSASAEGGVVLRPLTLAHAAALEMYGVELPQNVPEEKALLCAWLLSERPEGIRSFMADADAAGRAFSEWCATALAGDVAIERLGKAVDSVISTAFSTYVPGGGSSGGIKTKLMPDGYGWPLEFAETLVAEYGWTLEYALSLPLATAFGLIACARRRHGGEAGGPDYYQRGQIAAIKAMQRRSAAGKALKEKKADG